MHHSVAEIALFWGLVGTGTEARQAFVTDPGLDRVEAHSYYVTTQVEFKAIQEQRPI